MYSLAQFLKQIRKRENLSQSDLARILGVSSILVSKIEVGQKTVSRKFIELLSNKLQVHPGTLALFAFDLNKDAHGKLTVLERDLLEMGTKLQEQLILKKSKNLRINANKQPISNN
ncbi:MAG TPA: hypothetical protein DEP87_02435 [Candidatus Pacebacteria bacterium]|nr:hypothetical protein [Candidatus Paceibacterota bacterium]